MSGALAAQTVHWPETNMLLRPFWASLLRPEGEEVRIKGGGGFRKLEGHPHILPEVTSHLTREPAPTRAPCRAKIQQPRLSWRKGS